MPSKAPVHKARTTRRGDSHPPDWQSWFDRWEAQQEAFNPDRERRFNAMLEILDVELPGRFRALDLGAGPGALSQRLLRRFPRARCVAIDYDPVVVAIGRGALEGFADRLTWVEARLGFEGWLDALPRGKYDAAVSTTALHWLRPRPLVQLYRDLYRVIRPGGLLLNGDRLAWGRSAPRARRVEEVIRTGQARTSRRGSAWGAWERWWKEASRVPELSGAFEERARRRAEHPTTSDLPVEFHVRALRNAGFHEVDILWQNHEDRVIGAFR